MSRLEDEEYLRQQIKAIESQRLELARRVRVLRKLLDTSQEKDEDE